MKFFILLFCLFLFGCNCKPPKKCIKFEKYMVNEPLFPWKPYYPIRVMREHERCLEREK